MPTAGAAYVRRVDIHLRLAWAHVVSVAGESPSAGCDPEARHCRVRMERDGTMADAVALTSLSGPVRTRDRVLLNVTAGDLGLGSGGFHLVLAVPARLPQGNASGHLIKLRYSPLQLAVRSAGEQGSAGRESLATAQGLDAMPVICGSLHAQVAPAAVAFRRVAPGRRLAYVMTDGGALPAALVADVAELRRRRVLDAVITCGHAFGGDMEALGPAGALMAARWSLGCDAAIAALGPGVAGTGTRWDHTGLELASLIDLADGLDGRPIAVARVSFADARPRHHGVSHHTRTALALARAAALVAAPPGPLAALLRRELGDGRHQVVAAATHGLLAAVRAQIPGHTSMGRGWEREGPLFAVSAAAGALAALLVCGFR